MTETLMGSYQTLLDEIMQQGVYDLPQSQKDQQLLPVLNILHQHHQQHCPAYRNIVESNGQHGPFTQLNDVPFLAVRLFKQLELMSITEQQRYRTLQSSGTTSQTPARIVLDRDTSARQSRALVKIMQQWLGKQRLPMLIIDSPAILQDKKFSARAAGIQGLAFFGRDPTYALDENMQPNWTVIEQFVEQYAAQPVLIFGFTFMVWCHFIQALQATNRSFNLPNGILLHSGGWKKLEAQKVDNHSFKSTISAVLGVNKIHNFYGMAEQVGSVFVECEQGHLHTPMLADVIIRDPYTLSPCNVGEQGLIQVLSALPTSYPGYSILTEDLGELVGVDNCRCGRNGKHFRVLARLPKTEIRGCSDTQSGARQ